MFKSVLLYPTLIVSALARLNAPERNLGWWPWGSSDPYCAVTSESTGTSKISWRVFTKDDDPDQQDPHEETIEVMHADKRPYFQDGETKISLDKGVDYCLRTYKGDSHVYGSGRTTVKVSCFDEDENETTLAIIQMNGPTGKPHTQDHKCFRAQIKRMQELTHHIFYNHIHDHLDETSTKQMGEPCDES